MGAGKSTIGRAVATRLGWPYVDNDDLVRELGGAAPPAIAAARGIDELHRLEIAALEEVLRRPGPLVAGAAGFAVTDPGVTRLLRERATVCWLRARPATLRGPHRRRSGTTGRRPVAGVAGGDGGGARAGVRRRGRLSSSTWTTDRSTTSRPTSRRGSPERADDQPGLAGLVRGPPVEWPGGDLLHHRPGERAPRRGAADPRGPAGAPARADRAPRSAAGGEPGGGARRCANARGRGPHRGRRRRPARSRRAC